MAFLLCHDTHLAIILFFQVLQNCILMLVTTVLVYLVIILKVHMNSVYLTDKVIQDLDLKNYKVAELISISQRYDDLHLH